MKYDRQKLWNITTNRRDERSFTMGYEAVLNTYFIHKFTYTKSPKTPYQKGVNAGLMKYKEQQVIDILEGNNKPEPIIHGSSMDFAQFIQIFNADAEK